MNCSLYFQHIEPAHLLQVQQRVSDTVPGDACVSLCNTADSHETTKFYKPIRTCCVSVMENQKSFRVFG